MPILEDSKCVTCFYYSSDEKTIVSRSKPEMKTEDFDRNEYAWPYSLECGVTRTTHRHILTEDKYLVPDVSECSRWMSRFGNRPCAVIPDGDKKEEWHGYFHRYFEIDGVTVALVENGVGKLIRVALHLNHIIFNDEILRVEVKK